MNTLLITLQDEKEVIGVKYLHYTLIKNGYNSFLLYLPFLDFDNKNVLDEIKKTIYDISPGFIGISLMSINYYKACDLTKFLKNNFSNIPVIWGGIHPTVAPEMCLKHVDYVCIGEGEKTIIDFADTVKKKSLNKIKDIKNLCYLEDGKIKRNPLYPLIENLDEIPYYEFIPVHTFILDKKRIQPLSKKIFKKYSLYSGKTYTIISSRGCPFHCTYCINNFYLHLYKSNKVRRRSVGNIISELEKAVNSYPEIEFVNFEDDSFLSSDMEYLKEFCKEYKEKIKKPFIVHGIPIYINKERIRLLKDAGLSWINLGLESGSDRTLKQVFRRNSYKADFLKAANIIKEFKIAAFYDAIVDNPFEKEEDELETLKTIIDTPAPFILRVVSLTFFHGTEIYERAKKECPERIENTCPKYNFVLVEDKSINRLIKSAPYLSKRYMNKMTRLYKQNPTGIIFKINLAVINKFWVVMILMPFSYFSLIRLSYNGSFFKILKSFSKMMFFYYYSHIYYLFSHKYKYFYKYPF
jgi:radical SAM superfamily enzyme YgiQ (UPF0313 family)